MNKDKIVKVKELDLKALIDANVKAYNLLDEITLAATEVEEKTKRAFRALEEAPNEMSDIVIEEEGEE